MRNLFTKTLIIILSSTVPLLLFSCSTESYHKDNDVTLSDLPTVENPEVNVGDPISELPDVDESLLKGEVDYESATAIISSITSNAIVTGNNTTNVNVINSSSSTSSQ